MLPGLLINDSDNWESNNMLDRLNESTGFAEEAADVAVINKNVSAIVKSGIENLPTIYKTLITLYHHDELSYDEIGTITGLPAGTVKSYLFRARKELKNHLLLQYKRGIYAKTSY